MVTVTLILLSSIIVELLHVFIFLSHIYFSYIRRLCMYECACVWAVMHKICTLHEAIPLLNSDITIEKHRKAMECKSNAFLPILATEIILTQKRKVIGGTPLCTALPLTYTLCCYKRHTKPLILAH